jgi:hypothetical protein
MDLNKDNPTAVFRYEEDKRKYIQRLSSVQSTFKSGVNQVSMKKQFMNSRKSTLSNQSETSADRHLKMLKQGGGMSSHLRSGNNITTAHKKECERYREVSRENKIMALKLHSVQNRSNNYLFNERAKSVTIDSTPESYQRKVQKMDMTKENMRLYLKIVETRPSSVTSNRALTAFEDKQAKFKRNLGNKTSNSKRYELSAKRKVNEK